MRENSAFASRGSILALATAFALGPIAAPDVMAFCNVDAQPVGHALGGYVWPCFDQNPVQGYIYLLGSGQSGTNSGGQDVVCESSAGTNTLGQQCQFDAGSTGDGRVTVLEDWGGANPTIAGCPNTDGIPGHNPIGVQIVCNGGQRGVLYTVGYADFFTGYLLEIAHPLIDPTTVQPEIASGVRQAPQIRAFTGNQVSLHLVDLDDPAEGSQEARGYWSDCDPGSAGYGYTCDPSVPGRVPDIGRGKVYLKGGPCSILPDIRLSTGWIVPPNNPPGANEPDANGDVSLAFQCLSAPCTWVGATQTINGVETLAVSGAVPLCVPLIGIDVFQIDSGAFSRNTLTLNFSTQNEALLIGFNFYAEGRKLNDLLVPALGGNIGNRSYAFETTRGALKGAKSVVIEGVFSDGTRKEQPPFPIK